MNGMQILRSGRLAKLSARHLLLVSPHRSLLQAQNHQESRLFLRFRANNRRHLF